MQLADLQMWSILKQLADLQNILFKFTKIGVEGFNAHIYSLLSSFSIGLTQFPMSLYGEPAHRWRGLKPRQQRVLRKSCSIASCYGSNIMLLFCV